MITVENKIPDITTLVKQTDYNKKVSEIEKKVSHHNHDKYITTPEIDKFTAEVFDARLKQADLVTKTDFDTELISLNKKNKSNLIKQKISLLKTKLKSSKHLIQTIL